MFRTLRAKLIVSYIAIILLSLVLSGLASGMLVTRVRRTMNITQTQSLAMNVAQRLRNQQASVASIPQMVERLRQESDRIISGRLLVLSNIGKVIFDSEDGYLGQRVAPLPKNIDTTDAKVIRHRFADGTDYFLVVVKMEGERALGRFLAVGLAVQEVDPPWRELLPSLAIVAAIVTVVAIVVAIVLATTITRPLRQISKAAQGMATGDYGQTVPVRGHGEIAQLAESFNTMSSEVARAQRTQRDFIANVSHDLRTPLTSIQGFSQAIQEGAVTDPAGYRRAGEIIHGEANRMGQLVEDLLELARIESGQLDLATERVAIADLVHAEVSKARSRADAEGITLDASLPDGLPGLVVDPHRLEQVFANLIENAIKYGGEQGYVAITAQHITQGASRPAPLTVGWGALVDRSEWVMITCKNGGDAVSASDLPRIFERFYRGDRSRKNTSGSGLGLAIVRETILAHKGRIEAASDGDHGTTMRVWLPVHPNELVGKEREKAV